MGTPARPALLRRALMLVWLTLAWMTIEGVVALASGIASHSLTLSGFGVDSVIELVSACVLLWRLRSELRDATFSERAEHVATRLGAALLFLLAGYIFIGAGWSLWTRRGEGFSVPGLVVSSAAMPVMLVLARRKLAVAEQLGSRALRTDAVESVTCAWLAFVVVLGLAANRLLGAWWIDAATSLAILWFVLTEAREAWSEGAEHDE